MLKIALVQFNRNQERSHIFDRWVFGSADMKVPLIASPKTKPTERVMLVIPLAADLSPLETTIET